MVLMSMYRHSTLMICWWPAVSEFEDVCKKTDRGELHFCGMILNYNGEEEQWQLGQDCIIEKTR